MRTRSGIFRNSAALASGNFAAAIMALGFTAAMARTHGPAGLGMFQFAAAIASLTTLLVSLGLDALLVREIARDTSKANHLAAASLAIKSALSIPALGVIAILAAIKYEGIQGQLLLVLAAVALLDVMTATFTSVFRGFERMEWEAGVAVLGAAASTLAGGAALAAGWSLGAVATCWALGAVLRIGASFVLARGRFLTGRFPGSRGTLAAMATPSLACGALAVIGAVYSNADIVMLREMASEQEVGWYTAATKLIMVVLYLPSLLTASLFPVLSRQAGEPAMRGAARASYDRAFYALMLMGLPAGVGAMLVARPVIRMVYGDGFDAAATAMILLGPYLAFFFVNLVNGTAMIALGREKFLAVGTGIATVFNVAGNYFAIPRYGMAGACAVTVIASGAGVILYTIVCHRHLALRFRWSVAGRGAACAAIMGACVAAMARLNLHVTVLIPCGALVYAAGLVLTGLLPISWLNRSGRGPAPGPDWLGHPVER